MLNHKKKGNAGENKFAEFMRLHGFKAYKDSASGGSVHKGDVINDLDYNIEVKTVKKINLKEAWGQACKDSSLARNKPLLAVHFDGMAEHEWIICLHSSDWIELERGGAPQRSPFTDPKAKWAIERMIESGKAALKHFET